MSERSEMQDVLFDEDCRIVGQCCLALANNGAETALHRNVRAKF